jgi:dTMP kinase
MVTREPGGTQVGEEIRNALLHGGDDVPARTELLLMLAARAAFVERWCGRRWRRGEVVMADRYELSSLAYQGYGRGLPLEEVRRQRLRDGRAGGRT